MKAFIVFAAIIAVAAAGAVRSTGWGAPPASSIDLELAAAAAAVGSGSAGANQALLEVVSGNAAGPATLSSDSGVLAEVGQDENIAQVAVANIPSGSTSTINAVEVDNYAAGVDALDAIMSGANFATVQNSGATNSNGSGAIASEGGSYNSVSSRS